jgi:flavin-dependent dehydrogenase
MKIEDSFQNKPLKKTKDKSEQLKLADGSRIGVIGGGPAGSFFSYFLLDMAQRMGLNISVDIYEPRDFFQPSPAGCNMCGGIISETLVQMLATEGIILPPEIIQRGIDSYSLHTDVGSVRIETPLQEKRIGAVHRGCGPRGAIETKWGSFDGYLQILAIEKGAHLFQTKVTDVQWADSRPRIITRNIDSQPYDLIAVAVGINTSSLKIFSDLNFGYQPPQTTKTIIREFYLGEEEIARQLGSSMHVFLLDIPGLEFAAFIPKGDYVTFCMIGKDIDAALLESFFATPAVKEAIPSEIRVASSACHCNPRINISSAHQPFTDRMVFIGDCGVSRLYKDGIGAAYRTAKAAASTAIFEGISKADFKEYFWPACKSIHHDNLIGKFIFKITQLNQKFKFARGGILFTVRREQNKKLPRKYMSTVLWDMFTGSATYREILLLTLHPVFLIRLIHGLIVFTLSGFRVRE